MDTVLVTGGLGRSGRWIVDRLADDYDVICADLSQPGFEVPERPRIDFRAVDLTDRGEAFDLVSELDPDAVVHWAALPSPTRHAGGRVFETNTMATYNVLVAAARRNAKVVWASSESAYGFPFARETPLPDELPITENHPLRPEDPYGTSKVVGEELAKMVVRRYDVPVASIRPSWIQYPGEYGCRDRDDLREGRPLSELDLDAGVGNFWSYVDVRDVASLVAATLDAGFRGHEAFHAAAAENYLDVATLDAVEEQFGALPDDCDLDGDASALSTAKADRLLDWRPAHSWREAADESVTEPNLLAD
ncbi:NAD(P)-dependent oxidoreductase [Haloprofundus sp. MHR1]|uniref:NAD-dependent epimerase/dehydratase family protein n=1 Tax=Haloprofundus sp. MHR1 TaxID=2572921 RepID=UPI0010BEEF27|nr:NAD(P)-dependent oxidoreductase [Haloprofundus sp. MHR1]QCJ46903.1 NAD(P)-dependent oxidoreductase [Haloprofundus sp. MHR1]